MSIFSGELKMIERLIFQFIGLIYIAVGLGILLNPQYYKKMFMDFKTSLAVMYLGGIFAFAVGFFLITYHNQVQEVSVIIPIIGWLALIKGISILVFPKMMMKTMDIFTNVKTPVLMIMAGFIIALGAVIAWLGFFVV